MHSKRKSPFTTLPLGDDLKDSQDKLRLARRSIAAQTPLRLRNVLMDSMTSRISCGIIGTDALRGAHFPLTNLWFCSLKLLMQ